MIGCWRTRVSKQPISALYFESENELKFNYLEAMHVLKVFAGGSIWGGGLVSSVSTFVYFR